MLSNDFVASTNIVGPAPDKHIPNNPWWVSGVTEDRTSGRPGICTGVSGTQVGHREPFKGTYQGFSIWLMHPILHRLVNQFGIGGRLSECGGEDCQSLEIKNLWRRLKLHS